MPIKPASVVVEPPLMVVLSAVNSPPLPVGKRQPDGQIDAVVGDFWFDDMAVY